MPDRDAPEPPPIGVVRFEGAYETPITMTFVGATVETMIATKEALLGESVQIPREVWAVVGIYVLVGPAEASGHQIRVRPGYSGDVLARTREHAADPDLSWATRVVLARSPHKGWVSSEARYLEGRLHEALRGAPLVESVSRADDDRSLSSSEENVILRRDLPPVLATLQIAGIPVDFSAP
jgi:hypothetical protein